MHLVNIFKYFVMFNSQKITHPHEYTLLLLLEKCMNNNEDNIFIVPCQFDIVNRFTLEIKIRNVYPQMG